jgi:hypothetical protein
MLTGSRDEEDTWLPATAKKPAERTGRTHMTLDTYCATAQ